jgi:phage tail-like protein
MARSSSVDAVEGFRFTVFLLNAALDPVSIASNFTTFLRSGFSEVTLPRQTTGVIEYRENTDAAHPTLHPGISKYEPVYLKRGVTDNSDFLRWANTTHNPNQIIATSIERLLGAADGPPSEVLSFRRDLMIVLKDRTGASVKGWFLHNAWVSSYKPGDDLNATKEEKLIEELEVRYESFEEISKDALISFGLDTILAVL